ncbi:hypothetical protein AGABI2DRAFT_118495 [Agaricus bisporus var. bisporus H97]|uniref:hypothetical protein n=1 Tax=Agaricus bisporus var. bisporus (strain H97 / ATCC MYA-4626 / FGSC 10389) TaxID=936046 RepID=UPI00029F6039|nr:hypothetical protein AGABI2DRAFT_118495 [Agaricus bisporus var. bisporus H97]EKV46303.1 hypothetical protein AGABI2DRAFT_118495 [Agaricus bisporus var. bisporus H97]
MSGMQNDQNLDSESKPSPEKIMALVPDNLFTGIMLLTLIFTALRITIVMPPDLAPIRGIYDLISDFSFPLGRIQGS